MLAHERAHRGKGGSDVALAAEIECTMDLHQCISDVMRGFTTEVTPGSAAKIERFSDHLRPGTTVYVTFLPGSDFADTVRVATRLRDEGFEPVPHIAARSMPDRAFLEENLKRLRDEAGVDHVLVIAGGVDRPVGEFTDSMQILETGLLDKYGIGRIGIAGHPEGSPDIPDAAVRDALKWKNDFADRTGADLYIATQFCFEAAPIIAWDQRIQAEGNRLPVNIGIPGLATIKTLLNHAKACGVGNSMRFLTKQARNVTRLMSVSAPDQLVTGLARYMADDPGCGIRGVHMYPLGGLRKSALWTYAVIDGRFRLNADESGFKVDVDLG